MRRRSVLVRKINRIGITFIIVLTFVQLASATVSGFDYERNIVAFNPYAQTIDVFASGEFLYSTEYWNVLNKLLGYDEYGNSRRRSEKINVIRELLREDKTDESNNVDTDFGCLDYSRQLCFNFMGLDNFENYTERDKYVNNDVMNGRFGIPAYMAQTTKDSSRVPEDIVTGPDFHTINAIFVGALDPLIKDDPLDFYQWYFFEPQTDDEVKIGDWNMVGNGRVEIRTFYYMPDADGSNWRFKEEVLISFDLMEGNPVLVGSETNPNLILENPLRMDPVVEYDDDLTEIDIEYSENMNIDYIFKRVKGSADTELYVDRVELVHWYSDTLSASGYPEIEFDYTINFQTVVDIGVTPVKSELLSIIVKVRDNIAPVAFLSQNIARDSTGSNPIDIAKRYVVLTEDNSGLPVDVVYTTTPYPEWEDEFYSYYSVEVLVKDKLGNKTVLEPFSAGVRKEIEVEGIDFLVMYGPDEIRIKSISVRPGKGVVGIYDMKGLLLRQMKFNSVGEDMEQIRIGNNGIFETGTYIIKGYLKDLDGNVFWANDKFVVR